MTLMCYRCFLKSGLIVMASISMLMISAGAVNISSVSGGVRELTKVQATQVIERAKKVGASTKSIKPSVESNGELLGVEIYTELILPEVKAREVSYVSSTYNNTASALPSSVVLEGGNVVYSIKNTLTSDIPNDATITHRVYYMDGKVEVYKSTAHIKQASELLQSCVTNVSSTDISYNQFSEVLKPSMKDLQIDILETLTDFDGTVGIAYRYTKYDAESTEDEDETLSNPIFFTQRPLEIGVDGEAKLSLSLPLSADKLYYSFYFETELGKVFSEVRERDILELYEETTSRNLVKN